MRKRSVRRFVIRLRVNSHERAALRAKAKEAGFFTVSEYLRREVAEYPTRNGTKP